MTEGPVDPRDLEVLPRRVCPVCAARPAIVRFKPFCSRRCADVDLNRWLNGSYAIPAVESDEPDFPEE